MFEYFDIHFREDISFSKIEKLNISFLEIEKIFYSEYHVIYPGSEGYMIIGYTGSKMIISEFYIDYEKNKIIIDEIDFAKPQEVDEKYCKPRCS